jgi:predicted lipid-binding transport protein (Tim44 family)
MPAASGSQQGVRIGSGIGSGLSNAHLLPAGFDAEGFERNAKVNFIRLQAANDAGNLEDIRQFTTPEMFAELSLELGQREGSPQKTEVRSIHAEVLEVDENAHRYVVSVRFTGVIRDVDLAEDESFDEVWHLTKPRQGDSGWVLGGIQQMS